VNKTTESRLTQRLTVRLSAADIRELQQIRDRTKAPLSQIIRHFLRSGTGDVGHGS